MAETDGTKAFAAAIGEIDRQIEDLQRARDTLLRLMPCSPGDVPVGDPVLAVREQEFSGMSVAKAAHAFLRKIGRHEKTPVIIEALRKGGVDVRGKSPVSTVYTTLSRRPAFVALGKNYWDLAERRPDLAQGDRKAHPASARRTVPRNRRGKRPVRTASPHIPASA